MVPLGTFSPSSFLKLFSPQEALQPKAFLPCPSPSHCTRALYSPCRHTTGRTMSLILNRLLVELILGKQVWAMGLGAIICMRAPWGIAALERHLPGRGWDGQQSPLKAVQEALPAQELL